MTNTITIKLWTNNESAGVMYMQCTKQPAEIGIKSVLMPNRGEYQESCRDWQTHKQEEK